MLVRIHLPFKTHSMYQWIKIKQKKGMQSTTATIKKTAVFGMMNKYRPKQSKMNSNKGESDAGCIAWFTVFF